MTTLMTNELNKFGTNVIEIRTSIQQDLLLSQYK